MTVTPRLFLSLEHWALLQRGLDALEVGHLGVVPEQLAVLRTLIRHANHCKRFVIEVESNPFQMSRSPYTCKTCGRITTTPTVHPEPIRRKS